MFVQIYLLRFIFRNKTVLFLSSGRFLIVIEIVRRRVEGFRLVELSGLVYYVFQIMVYELIII